MSEIRPATNDEIPELTEMWDEFMEYHRDLREWAYTLAEDAHEQIEERFETYIEANKKLVLVVLDQNSEPSGFAVARVEEPSDVFDVGAKVRITDFYLRPSARGKKLGTELVERVSEWGREQGGEKLFMSIDADNDAGRAFWEALGFECTKKTYLTDL